MYIILLILFLSITQLARPWYDMMLNTLTLLIVKFRPKFLESRRVGLEYFLK
jgi:hypothetical protein